jgi:hypothetical protein
VLRGYLDGSEKTANLECLLGASTDAVLVGKVIKKHGSPWYLNSYHVFDIV